MTLIVADEAPAGPHPASAAEEWPRLVSDVDVCVCVIGAGVAGLTAALTLARAGRSVAVLEAGRLGGGASAVNAGIVLPGYANLDGVVARVGLPSAKALWSLSVEGERAIRATVSAAAMRPAGHLFVQRRNDAAKLRARADWLREIFGAEVAFRSADDVRALLPSSAYFQGLHWPDALNLVPDLYLRDLAAAAAAAGARIFTQSAALGIDADGLRKRVDTAAARVRAADIVVAAGAKLGALLPRAARAGLTLEIGLVETESLPPQMQAAFRFAGAVSEAGVCHQLVGGALVWSGAATTRNTGTPALARRLRAEIGQTYPLLRGLALRRTASASVTTTVHRMPHVGPLAPGIWLGAGFGRIGLANAAMGGLLIARAIAEGDDRWRLLEPFGLVSAGGRAGRLFAEAALRARRAAVQIRSLMARLRAAPAPVPAIVEDHAPEAAAAAAPKAGQPARKKPATPRKRAPRKPKIPAPAEVVAVDRRPAAGRAGKGSGPRKRRTAPAKPKDEVAPVPPERLH